MTIGEQMEAAVERLSDEHRQALEHWSGVEEEHAAISGFLDWAKSEDLVLTTPGGVPVDPCSLVNRYLVVDEDLLDGARRALLSNADAEEVGSAEDRPVRDPRVLAEIEDFRAGGSSLDDEQILALRVCRTGASGEVDALLDLIERMSGITIKALDGEAKTP